MGSNSDIAMVEYNIQANTRNRRPGRLTMTKSFGFSEQFEAVFICEMWTINFRSTPRRTGNYSWTKTVSWHTSFVFEMANQVTNTTALTNMKLEITFHHYFACKSSTLLLWQRQPAVPGRKSDIPKFKEIINDTFFRNMWL